MMYYYFAAALPALSLEGERPMPFEAFCELCREYLSSADLAALQDLAEPGSGDPDHPFVRAWRKCETLLQNALVRVRAGRLRRDAALYLREQEGWDTHAERAAADAFSKKDPLARELSIDRFRWSTIEELAGYNPFTGKAVLAYALKLRLVERWAAMRAEAAATRLENLVAREPVGEGRKA